MDTLAATLTVPLVEHTSNTAVSTRPEFGIFYVDTYSEMVTLATIIGSGPEAEDLVQDCYLRLYRRYYTLHDPRTYLRRSIINGRRSWLRRPQHRNPPPHPLPDNAAPPAPSLEDQDLLLTALARLPHNQRAALVLRYYLDLPDAAIAPALGVKVATVASLIHRGLAALRTRLPDETTPSPAVKEEHHD
jgi:RNA polymerase sigma factor (sigma-70 family)